jgi:hypothetical protein
MKESELIQLRNKVKNQEGIIQALLSQIANLKDLSIGTLETLKRMPGYQKAVDQLKEDIQIDSGKKTEEPQELVK